jgi:hypothetical protein
LNGIKYPASGILLKQQKMDYDSLAPSDFCSKASRLSSVPTITGHVLFYPEDYRTSGGWDSSMFSGPRALSSVTCCDWNIIDAQ